MAIIVNKVDILSYSVCQWDSKQCTDFYLVFTDDGTPLTAVQAESASGVPVKGSVSPDDSTRVFKQKRPQCLDNANRTHWQVQVDYDSNIPSSVDPTTLPAVIAWDYSDGTETYFTDHASLYGGITEPSGASVTTDQPVTTSAGETFEKLGERENGTWSSTWTKNVANTFTIASEIGVMQFINSSSFTYDGETIAQYAAKISGGSLSGVQTQNGYEYRTLVYKLKFRDGGWIDRYEDRGLMELGDSPTQLIPITAGAPGTPVTPVDKPWPLDGSGSAKTNSTDLGEELDFYPYKPMSFSGFGFS